MTPVTEPEVFRALAFQIAERERREGSLRSLRKGAAPADIVARVAADVDAYTLTERILGRILDQMHERARRAPSEAA